MSLTKIERLSIPKSARDNICADIRAFLNNDCEYLWDSTHEMLLERHPDGTVYRMNFTLQCFREKAIQFDTSKLKADEEVRQ